MASLLLRRVLLPLVRPLPRRVSLSAPLHSSASLNNHVDVESLVRLSKVLDETANQVENEQNENENNDQGEEEDEPMEVLENFDEMERLEQLEGIVKPFRPNVPLRPRDFTQKYRTEKIRTSKGRLVAPTAAKARREDIFHLLNMDPLSLTNHPSILGYFVSEMGMIYPRTYTHLTPKSQRAVSRAIRRAKMMGIMPTHSEPKMR